jgi:hypothetical protein
MTKLNLHNWSRPKRIDNSEAFTIGDIMAISHDLSSEIATALLAVKDKSPREREHLKEILLIIHSTLQRLTEEERVAQAKSQPTVKKLAAHR